MIVRKNVGSFGNVVVEKVFMVVGVIGVGKIIFINGMVNYILGV